MSPDPALARAETLLALGRNDEAAAVITSALASDPDDVALVRLLASAHLQADRLADARDVAWRAVKMEPDHEWGHRMLSEALSRLASHDYAIYSAAESQRLAPMQWRTHTQRAIVSGRAGKADDAMAAARHAVELAPNEPSTHFALGYAAKLAGDTSLAEQAYERTLALKPDHAMALNNLSALQLKRGGLRSATRGFGSALAADPQLDIARRNLSVVARRYTRRFHLGVFAAFILVSITSQQPQTTLGNDHVPTGSRLLVGGVCLAAVAVLIGAAVVVDRRLPANLRPYFRRLPRTDKWLGAWLIVDATALVLIGAVAIPSTYSGRSSVAAFAWLFLFVGLALSYRQRFVRWTGKSR